MKKKYLLFISIFVFITVVSISYAYFASTINNSNPQRTSVTTGDLRLIFSDNANSVNLTKSITLGDTITKKFTIKNEGRKDLYARIIWKDIVNTYMNGSLVYSLVMDETNDLLVDNTNVPVSNNPTDITLKDNILVLAGGTAHYTLTITYVDNGLNQNSDGNANLTTFFKLSTGSLNSQTELNRAIYAWDYSLLSNNNIRTISTDLKELQVKDIYLAIDFNKDPTVVGNLIDKGFDVYSLTGNIDWYNKPNIYKSHIDNVYTYNQAHPDKPITGVVYDVEMAFDSSFNEDVVSNFETYIETLEEIHNYANSKNIRVVNVIPFWYDNYYRSDDYTVEEKTRLYNSFVGIFTNSDRISVMNYNINAMSTAMSDEISVAKANNVEIESAAELGDTKETNATLYLIGNDEFEELETRWSALDSVANYDKLTYSYHHLNFIEVIKGSIDRYQLEFRDSNNNLITSGTYSFTVDNGDIYYKSLNEEMFTLHGHSFTINLAGYDSLKLVSETSVDKHTKKRVYKTVGEAKPVVDTYLYIALWNGSSYGPGPLNGGKVVLRNTVTNETNEINISMNNDGTRAIRTNFVTDTNYEFNIYDNENNIIANTIKSLDYSGSMHDVSNNYLNLPSTVENTHPAYAAIYMDLE